MPQVLELIEISPVNSDLQLSALRLLTNISVTDKHHHLLKESITLLLSLLVVSNENLQVGKIFSSFMPKCKPAMATRAMDAFVTILMFLGSGSDFESPCECFS